MPRNDGTGPIGMGPMTGRGSGYCIGYVRPGDTNYFRVRFSGGMSGGRGFRRMFNLTGVPGWQRNGYAMPIPDGQDYDEKAVLEKEQEFLEAQLRQIKESLNSLD